MAERWISMLIAIAAIGLGIDNIVSQRGSHILGRVGPHYTGLFATAEGILFIAVGCGLLYRVWRKRHQSKKK